MSAKNFIAILYLLTSSCYIILGTRVLSEYKENRSNQLYFLTTFSLAIWSFSLAMSNLSYLYTNALRWHQVSSFGWTFFFPLLFLFVLSVFESKILEKKSLYVVIFIASMINIFLHVFLGEFSKNQFNLVMTEFGWINRQFETIGNYYFTLFFIIFTELIFIEILLFIFDTRREKRADVMLILKKIIPSVIICASLSIVLELVLNTLNNKNYPQLAVVLILVPTLSIYFESSSAGFLSRPVQDVSDLVQIDEYSKRLFEMIGTTYISYGFLTIGTNHLIFTKFSIIDFIFSLIFIISGIIHFFVPQVVKEVDKRYSIFTFSLIILIIGINIMYFSMGGIVVWTIFFVFLIASFLFEKRGYSLIIVSTMILSQLYYIVKMPNIRLQIRWPNYVIRIIIIIFIYIIVSYVNNSFNQKIIETDKHA